MGTNDVIIFGTIFAIDKSVCVEVSEKRIFLLASLNVSRKDQGLKILVFFISKTKIDK